MTVTATAPRQAASLETVLRTAGWIGLGLIAVAVSLSDFLTSVPAAAHPATRSRSRCSSASYVSRPRPGHAVTSSTTNDPLSSAPKTSPPMAATGFSDSRQA